MINVVNRFRLKANLCHIDLNTAKLNIFPVQTVKGGLSDQLIVMPMKGAIRDL